jgi:transposase
LRSPAVKEVAAEDHTAVMKVWAKRHRDLSRHRTRLACRLHAVLCELVPGGIPGEISAAQAARLLDEVEPHGAVATARHELALELVADLGRLDAQLRNTKKRIAAAVAASKTTTTELFGVGPIVAAIVIGDTGDVSRFASRDHFAAYNGTAPIEVSSGPRKIHRLSRRGNRRLNHAIHMVAITQIRFPHSDGRAYYDRKIAEGKTGKEALRALKRRISDALYRQLQLDARRAAASATAGPGGQAGNDSEASVTGSHPEHRLFGEATPEPTITLRPPQARDGADTRSQPREAIETRS